MTGISVHADPCLDRHWLDRAACMAVRGLGGAAPNPLVGCIVLDQHGRFISSGYHRQCGEAHAEVMALNAAGDQAAGGTLVVTLEPCGHTGRTAPCTESIIRAGIERVVIGHRDVHPKAAGGADALAQAGIEVVMMDHAPSAHLVEPFFWTLRTGLPWLVVKWAQSIDGRMATRTGQSQWISSPQSRRLVHRMRGRVDAILTGIGTVRCDDPQLTARGVRKRRTATRVIIDPRADLPLESSLIATLDQAPLMVICLPSASPERQESLRQLGVTIHHGHVRNGRIDLEQSLRSLHTEHHFSNMLVEAGPGLISALHEEDLIREAAIFIAPILIADQEALPPLQGQSPSLIAEANRLILQGQHVRGQDVLLRYGVPERPKSIG